jgi:hypothetical protein
MGRHKMAELFGVQDGGMAKHIDEFPFQDEVNDLESFIKKNPEVVSEGLEIFGEQVDTGAGDRIDLLALSKTAATAQITLIELKNGIAQQTVLLQTLRYASWIKNNPDSIKYLLEKKRVSVDDIEFNPKIIIIAPQIDPTLIELSQYNQAFEFDFVEVRRFGTMDNFYVVVDHRTSLQSPTTRVSSQEEWNWEKYETELRINRDEIEIAKSVFDKLMSIFQEKQWSLNPRFRKGYVAFQFGGRNVIIISFWIKSRLCFLGFKLGQLPEKLGLENPYPDAQHKFFPDYGEYHVRIESKEFDISKYTTFMYTAYHNVIKE